MEIAACSSFPTIQEIHVPLCYSERTKDVLAEIIALDLLIQSYYCSPSQPFGEG
jgi:hypothetical protein